MPLLNKRKVPANGDRAVVATAAVTFFVMVFLLPVSILEAKKTHGKVNPASLCAQCDKSKCPVIGPVPVQFCPPHSIVRDACGCCERCTALIVVPTAAPKAHSCTNITCPARQMCMVNIQGLPVCRCPTEQMCRDFWPRPVKVCASEGGLAYVTYPSECHMRVATCNYPSRRIKLLHRGACDDSVRLDDFQPTAASKLSKGRDAFGWIERQQQQQQLVMGIASTSFRMTTIAKVTSKTATSLTTLSSTPTTMMTTSARPTTSSTASSTTPRPTTVTTAAATTIIRTTDLPTATIAAIVVASNEPFIQPSTLQASGSVARSDVSSSSQLATSARGRNRSPRVQNQDRNREGKRRDRAAAAAAAASAHLAGAGRSTMRHGGGGSGSGRENGDKASLVGEPAPYSS